MGILKDFIKASTPTNNLSQFQSIMQKPLRTILDEKTNFNHHVTIKNYVSLHKIP